MPTPRSGLSKIRCSAATNPFLHMGLHLAVREQFPSTGRPGIRDLERQLQARYGDAHLAEHALMEALGEELWMAQREGRAPDEKQYLALARNRAGRAIAQRAKRLTKLHARFIGAPGGHRYSGLLSINQPFEEIAMRLAFAASALCLSALGLSACCSAGAAAQSVTPAATAPTAPRPPATAPSPAPSRAMPPQSM